MPNLLSGQPSAYLKHASRQPVHWLPWGDDAFKKAREENKPILLDIGASWCHWCHVMDRESYEDPGIAALINERFVPVKVDRDMRPDVDRRYQEAVSALSGQGGWPLTVFLAPDGAAFYGGTYFPPTPRLGLPGFRQVLEEIGHAFQENQGKLEAISDVMNRAPDQPAAAGVPDDPSILMEAAQGLLNFYDQAHGGFGHQPKFPNAEALLFLSHLSSAQDTPDLLDPVLATLKRMTDGGVYDQLGGGFHRYATDEAWTVPHFEKMLCDNALLLCVMAEAYTQAREPWLLEKIEGTVEFLLRDLRGPHGAFLASQDADSGGKEGAYFVWKAEEVRTAVDTGEYAVAEAHYGLTEPNFEGQSVLRVAEDLEPAAKRLKLDPERARSLLTAAKAKLFARRLRRTRPFIDPTVHLCWNGLAIAGLAQASMACGRPEWAQAAAEAVDFIEANLKTPGGYAHAWSDHSGSGPAYCDDYVAYALGLFALSEALGENRHLELGRTVLDAAVARFFDEGFYFAEEKGQAVWPQRPVHDFSAPSANGLGLLVLATAAAYFPEAEYSAKAGVVAGLFLDAAMTMPLHAGTYFQGLLRLLHPPIIFAAVGPPPAPKILEVIARVPNRIVVRPPHPLAADKPPAERATVYVCAGTRCLPPATTPAELEDRLREIAKAGQ